MLNVDRVSHLMIYAEDVARAASWYADHLGFKKLFVAPGAYASLLNERLGFRLDLHQTVEGQGVAERGASLYLHTPDLDAALSALKAQGVRVGEARQEGASPRFASVWDSEGNVLGLTE